MNRRAERRGHSSRRTLDIAQGVASLLGAAAILVGVPLALAALVGWPLPHAVPSPNDVGDALTQGDVPDGILVKALACILWLVWAQLAVAFVAEAIAIARGRRAPSVPAVGGIRRTAARLVAGIALLGAIAPTARAVAPLLRPETPPAATPVAADTRTAPKAIAPTAAPAPVALPEYVVQRRDTLWDIAERHLGDPFRWCEIFELNRGAPQPGGRTLSDADLILPGWRLQLPADAVGLAAPEPEKEPAPPKRPDVVAVSTSTSPEGDDGETMVRLDDATPQVAVDTITIADNGDVLVRLPDGWQPPSPEE